MNSSTFYHVAADLVLFSHIAFVGFVVLGLLLVIAGKFLNWAWVRNPWFRIIHLLAIAIVVMQSWLGIICPLTTWEMGLRERAGDSVYAGTFISDDITADNKGNLYITGMTPISGEVYRVDQSGMKTVIASGFKAPNGIQYNFKTGRLFMTECFQGNRVFELDPAGIKPPRLMIKENVIPIPEGFGFDQDGRILAVDTGVRNGLKRFIAVG